MSPRIANKDKAVLPKVGLFPGSVAVYPANLTGADWLKQQWADVLITDTTQSVAGKPTFVPSRETINRSVPSAIAGKSPAESRAHQAQAAGTQPYSNQPTIYKGLSEGYFRGRLPETIVAFVEDETIVKGIATLMLEHVAKLRSFGFLIPETRDSAHPLEQALPYWLLVGPTNEATLLAYTQLSEQLRFHLHQANLKAIGEDKLLQIEQLALSRLCVGYEGEEASLSNREVPLWQIDAGAANSRLLISTSLQQRGLTAVVI